jgi:hypothetical protein
MSRNRFRSSVSLLAVALSALAAGCAEQQLPSEPAVASLSTSAGTSVLNDAETVSVLKRNAPIQRLSASAEIGRMGGTIEIKEAGLRVVFPRNAVQLKGRSTVTITVTALEGDLVAYEFQPHGLVFSQPVSVLQDSRFTTANRHSSFLASVKGAYVPELGHLDARNATAPVTEYRPTEIDLVGNRIRFTVDHFSGYIVSSGRQPGGE